MNNKKGLSAIVATVLIILLVIAAVTLVWGPVRNMINKQSEEVEANCLMVNPTIDSACLSGGGLLITISNGAEVVIDGFQTIYGPSATNITQSDTTTGASGVGINSVVTYNITSPIGTVGSVKVAPIVNGQTCGAGEVKTVAASC